MSGEYSEDSKTGVEEERKGYRWRKLERNQSEKRKERGHSDASTITNLNTGGRCGHI